jgi:hypothetical protein
MDLLNRLIEFRRNLLHPKLLRTNRQHLNMYWLQARLNNLPSSQDAFKHYEQQVLKLLQEGAIRANAIGMILAALNHDVNKITSDDACHLVTLVDDLAADLNKLSDSAPTLRSNPEECPLREARTRLNSETKKAGLSRDR